MYISIYARDRPKRLYKDIQKEDEITLIRILVYVLEADPKKAVKSIYRPRN